MDKKITSKKARDMSATKRQYGVLFEHMDEKFEQVLEGHAALDKEAKDFRHEMRREVGFLSLGLSNANVGLKDLSVKVDRSQDETKKLMMDYFSAIDEELKHISRELAALKGRFSEKADIAYVHSVEKRVVALESELLKLRKS